jgi:hypothetical protein
LCTLASFTYTVHATRGRTRLLVTALSSRGGGSFGTEAGHLTTPDIDEDEVKQILYVADIGNNRVKRFTRPGFLSQWGTIGSGPGQSSNPGRVDVDSLGNVIVADFVNDRIEFEFDDDGNSPVRTLSKVRYLLVVDHQLALLLSSCVGLLASYYHLLLLENRLL